MQTLSGETPNPRAGVWLDRLAVGALAAAALAIALTFRDYGSGWDDQFQARYGDLILSHIASLGADQRLFSLSNLSFYGGLFEALSQLLAKASPLAVPETRHLVSALAGFAGIVGVWRMARHLGGEAAGPLAGLLAVVLLASLPAYWGHQFINTKDIPFAAATIWTLYLAARAAEQLPRVPARLAVLLGVALGAALGVRIGGVVLVAYMGVLLATHLLWRRGRAGPPPQDAAKHVFMTATIVALVATVLTFSLWPASWDSPLKLAYLSLLETGRFSFAVDVRFMGRDIPSTDLPSSYLPVYFWIKLPEVLLLALGVSIPLAAVQFANALRTQSRRLVFGFISLGLGAGFPPLYAIITQATLYDGIRHFLFVLPPAVVLCAVVLSRAVVGLQRGRNIMMGLLVASLGAGIAMNTLAMVRLHPYQYVYYNRLVGGLAGAAGRYELDYWATAYRELAGQLVALTASEAAPREPLRVLVCGPISAAFQFLPATFEPVLKLEEADFVINFTRWSCDRAIAAPVIAEVTRQGVRLGMVQDVRGGFELKKPFPGTIFWERF